MGIFNESTSEHIIVFNSTNVIKEKIDGIYKIHVYLKDQNTNKVVEKSLGE